MGQPYGELSLALAMVPRRTSETKTTEAHPRDGKQRRALFLVSHELGSPVSPEGRFPGPVQGRPCRIADASPKGQIQRSGADRARRG